MAEGFTGTGVALVTPFKNDGTVDVEALTRVVNHTIDGGVEYLVVMGTTGEPATLTKDEKKKVLDTVLAVNDNRLPVILGIGGNNTAELVNTIEQTDFSSISHILSVSPYYNKPSQEGIYQHFAALADVSPVPIILYNVPGRTSSNISAETTLRLAESSKKFVAIKEASGDFSQIMKIIMHKPSHFDLISGDDALTLPMTLIGGKGAISVVANSHPSEFSSMIRAALNNEVKVANDLHYKLIPVIDLLFAEGSPAGVKAVLNQLGLCEPNVRLPLVPASKSLMAKVGEIVK